MPRSRRSRQTGWWPGQHHRRASGGSPTGLIRGILPLILALTPASAQNLLNIRVVAGEGAIHGSASRASRPIVVEVTDETGRPVEGAAVSFRMPEEGPSASFSANMKTDIRITTPDGRAVCADFTAGRTSGPFQVRVIAVKSQVRAGIVVSQYVSDAAVKSVRGRGSKKWVALLAIAGAAGAGIAAGAMGGGSTAVTANTTSPVSPTPPSVGPPSIVVGGPQ